LDFNKQSIGSKLSSKEAVSIDFQKILSRMLSFWWLFLLCIIAAIAAGRFYLRYTTFQYTSSAVLLVKDAGKGGSISAETILSQQLASGREKSMDNEIQILKSLTLMEKVVEKLNLQVAYYRIGSFKEAELYDKTPFLLDSFELKKELGFSQSFYLEQEDYTSFIFKKNEEDPGNRYYYDVPFETNDGRFLFKLSPSVAVIKGPYRFTIFTTEACAYVNKRDLIVERVGSQYSSSVLKLSKIDPVPEKARDVVNTLIEVYNEEEIKDENTVLRNTLEFIDDRIASLTGELDSVEFGIQKYKSSNAIIGADAASSMDYTLGEVRAAIQELSKYEVQKSILESLESFMTKDQLAFELIPASLVADNPILSVFVDQYNNLVQAHKKITKTASEINPVRIEMEAQMTDLRALILETIRNLKKDLDIPVAQIEKNIDLLKGSMSSIPGIEKQLVEKMRTQAVKENLFLMLLQKREETALSEAITVAKTRTIERARLSKSPIYPKRKLITMFSAAAGLLVPFVLVLVLLFFENKIDSEETITQLTNIPIIGRIAHYKGKEKLVVKLGKRSAINEMFRLLRTNLGFVHPDKKQQTILFTSSVSAEGKTFIAINLRMTLALANKKVVIIGLDLRKPKMGQYIDDPDGKGVTNFLIGQSDVDEIIKVHKENSSLSYITSGPVPPNPTELILSDKMGELLDILKSRFDYVLIDTPPIGLVSDALLLRQKVDNILIVVRHKYTHKVMVKNLEQMYANNELEKASIIFNGVKRGRGYYGYGAYKYGYNQDYYVDEA